MDNPVMTRRNALIGAFTSAAVIAFPAAAAAPQLRALIDAYRRADALVVETDEAAAEAQNRFRELAPHVMVPLNVMPDGRSPSGWADLNVLGRDAVVSSIETTEGDLLNRHCTTYVKTMAPELAEQMRLAICDGRDKAMTALADAEALVEQCHQTTGRAAAEAAYEAASDALYEARIAVLGYVPADASEAAAKAEWIAELVRSGFDVLDSGEWSALLSSIAGVEITVDPEEVA